MPEKGCRSAYQLQHSEKFDAKEEGYPDALEGAKEPVLQELDGGLVLVDAKECFLLPLDNEAVDREQNGERDAEGESNPEKANHSPQDCRRPCVLRAAEEERENDRRTQYDYARRHVSDKLGTQRNIRAPAIATRVRDILSKFH